MSTVFIVLSGPDGSGKTAIIARLREELLARGRTVGCAWLRYNHVLAKPLHAFSRLVGLSVRRRDGEGRLVWRHAFHRCESFRRLYVAATYLDTALSSLKARWLCWRAGRPEVFICDRWVSDVLVDLAADTRLPGLLRNGWRRRFTALMPEGTRQYVVERDPVRTLAARPEYRGDREHLLRRRLYARLGGFGGLKVLRNDGSVEEAALSIAEEL